MRFFILIANVLRVEKDILITPTAFIVIKILKSLPLTFRSFFRFLLSFGFIWIKWRFWHAIIILMIALIKLHPIVYLRSISLTTFDLTALIIFIWSNFHRWTVCWVWGLRILSHSFWRKFWIFFICIISDLWLRNLDMAIFLISRILTLRHSLLFTVFVSY